MSERFQAKVRDLTNLGQGVVDRDDGRVFFVDAVWPGDEGEFEVISLEKRYGYARLVQLKRQSDQRREAPCPHQGYEVGKCGGCPWMIANYESQVHFKQKIVRHTLGRAFSKVDLEKIQPLITAPNEFGFRNRAQFKTDGKVLGYVSPGTQTIAAIESCLVLNERCSEILSKLKSKLPNSDWIPNPGRPWNFLEIDDEIDDQDFEKNKRRPFKQANTAQNERMRHWIEQRLSESDSKVALELFCGSGNFTEVMASSGQFKKILATEVSDESIFALQERKLQYVVPMKFDIFRRKSWYEIHNEIEDAELLLLDPPRIGFKRLYEVVELFDGLKEIIYISCNLSNLARDISRLIKRKWEITQIQPVDQFPQTPHIEVLLHLRNKA